MSRTASVGFVALMGRPMATSQDFANWICGPDLDPEFLMWILVAARPYLRFISSGATHKTIYMRAIKSFQIYAPPLQEQQRIGRLLTEKQAGCRGIAALLEEQRTALAAMPVKLVRTEMRTQA